ncbi:hypothetical protein IX51_08015 [uncultured archaeon]|nr:hypothetical protein IX51_08015 [uncultured archaeon]
MDHVIKIKPGIVMIKKEAQILGISDAKKIRPCPGVVALGRIAIYLVWIFFIFSLALIPNGFGNTPLFF